MGALGFSEPQPAANELHHVVRELERLLGFHWRRCQWAAGISKPDAAVRLWWSRFAFLAELSRAAGGQVDPLEQLAAESVPALDGLLGRPSSRRAQAGTAVELGLGQVCLQFRLEM